MAYTKRKPPIGARPGTLAIPADATPPVIATMCYSAEFLDENAEVHSSQIGTLHRSGATSWVDVRGLGDEATLWELANQFNIHPLALEDVVNVPQRPKSELYPDHQFLVIRMMQFDAATHHLDVEQVSLVITEDAVVTFQERLGDILDPVRKRIRDNNTRIRKSGTDYLAYAIIDTIVDGYFPILETLGEELEDLEQEIIDQPSVEHLSEINRVKGTLLQLRRSLWPTRDMLNSIVRDDNPFFTEQAQVYFRDTYDHVYQLVEVLESHREVVSGLMNTYLSVQSNRTNEVMKVLTIMASIFIPLTFIAGVYGMNFEHMPELKHPWAYPTLWGVMSAMGIGLFIYFRRKGWIGNQDRSLSSKRKDAL